MEKSVLKTRTEFELRPATAGDVEAIHSLILALAEYEKLSHMVVATPADLARWLYGENAVIEAMVATVGNETVGFALWYRTYSTFLGRPGIHLEDLFVKPERRGLGIGRAMLVELARIAEGSSAGRLEWNVLDWNTPSIEFYKSLGAKLMPEWVLVRMIEREFKELAARP
jgi:GNAT superfamily N-acetyltransferase